MRLQHLSAPWASLRIRWASVRNGLAFLDWPKSLILATASPGGVFYVYGEAMAKILTESLKIDVNHLPT